MSHWPPKQLTPRAHNTSNFVFQNVLHRELPQPRYLHPPLFLSFSSYFFLFFPLLFFSFLSFVFDSSHDLFELQNHNEPDTLNLAMNPNPFASTPDHNPQHPNPCQSTSIRFKDLSAGVLTLPNSAQILNSSTNPPMTSRNDRERSHYTIPRTLPNQTQTEANNPARREAICTACNVRKLMHSSQSPPPIGCLPIFWHSE